MKRIVLHQPNGANVTFSDCAVMSCEGGWLRFKGTNDMGKEVVLSTSLPAEIYEQ